MSDKGHRNDSTRASPKDALDPEPAPVSSPLSDAVTPSDAVNNNSNSNKLPKSSSKRKRSEEETAGETVQADELDPVTKKRKLKLTVRILFARSFLLIFVYLFLSCVSFRWAADR